MLHCHEAAVYGCGTIDPRIGYLNHLARWRGSKQNCRAKRKDQPDCREGNTTEQVNDTWYRTLQVSHIVVCFEWIAQEPFMWFMERGATDFNNWWAGHDRNNWCCFDVITLQHNDIQNVLFTGNKMHSALESTPAMTKSSSESSNSCATKATISKFCFLSWVWLWFQTL